MLFFFPAPSVQRLPVEHQQSSLLRGAGPGRLQLLNKHFSVSERGDRVLLLETSEEKAKGQTTAGSVGGAVVGNGSRPKGETGSVVQRR